MPFLFVCLHVFWRPSHVIIVTVIAFGNLIISQKMWSFLRSFFSLAYVCVFLLRLFPWSSVMYANTKIKDKKKRNSFSKWNFKSLEMANKSYSSAYEVLELEQNKTKECCNWDKAPFYFSRRTKNFIHHINDNHNVHQSSRKISNRAKKSKKRKNQINK